MYTQKKKKHKPFYVFHTPFDFPKFFFSIRFSFSLILMLADSGLGYTDIFKGTETTPDFSLCTHRQKSIFFLFSNIAFFYFLQKKKAISYTSCIKRKLSDARYNLGQSIMWFMSIVVFIKICKYYRLKHFHCWPPFYHPLLIFPTCVRMC